MKRRITAERIATAAWIVAAAWLTWDTLRCPGCRAEAEQRGARRARKRHEQRHRKWTDEDDDWTHEYGQELAPGCRAYRLANGTHRCVSASCGRCRGADDAS